ncbi:hypothetical protein VTJ83DRAFT_4681 [Remersonia thermophila]|uniref:Uncharacterized protein n=1 Tax=Remersonia thermophila TaxID=72144 RepID=A0ABR4DCP0_9PEZI
MSSPYQRVSEYIPENGVVPPATSPEVVVLSPLGSTAAGPFGSFSQTPRMDEQHAGRTAFTRPNRPPSLENLGFSEPSQTRWDPALAATPGTDSPAPPHTGTTFVPVSPLPSGLGIKLPADAAARYPRYQPVMSRDPSQPDEDGFLGSPPLPGASTTSTLTPEQQPFSSPYGVPYYYYLGPHGPSTPGPLDGHGEPEASATWWRMFIAGWPMYGMFLLGLGCALGHHAFYSYLDGKPANDQVRMVRFGGFLAYAAKACFVGAVVYAYRQQIWVTVINKVLTLRTIDSLFAAAYEPKALMNWDFISNARVAAGLAMLVWLFPMTVILTPATLTVAPRVEVQQGLCPGVRTLNFESEGAKNWRNLERINGYRVVSLSLYNSTVKDSHHLTEPFNSTFFDYYTGSSLPVDLVAAQSVLTGAVIPRRHATLETCGGGWNCSYQITFVAPAYKCSVFAKGPAFDMDQLMLAGAPQHFHPNNLMPNGDYSYLAETNAGNYARKQLDVAPGGAPLMKPPFPKHLGAFRTEPALWIGYSRLTRPGKPPLNRTDPDWNTAFEAVVLRCEHYLANYIVRFNHTSSGQTTKVLRRDFLRPVINTTYDPLTLAVDDGTLDNTTAIPKSNYVLPVPDFETYRVVAAYHSLGSRLRAYLQGVIQFLPFADPQTEATKTRIIDVDTYLPATNLAEAIQGLYENITLSLLSNPQFAVVAWAARPDLRSGVSSPPDGNNQAVGPYEAASGTQVDEGYPYKYPCTRTRLANAYVFNRRDMWIAYAAALSVALLAVVLGSAALSQNGLLAREAMVSNIVAATRAPALDRLPWGDGRMRIAERGKGRRKWGEVPDEVLYARLGYGAATAEDAGVEGKGKTTGWEGSVDARGNRRMVYYGFLPEETLQRQRQGRLKNRMSAWSFKVWEEYKHRD